MANLRGARLRKPYLRIILNYRIFQEVAIVMARVLQLCFACLNHKPAGLSRNAVKTISYALMHLVVAMSVAFALTRNWHAALAIGLVEPLVQTLAYSMHERAWARG